MVGFRDTICVAGFDPLSHIYLFFSDSRETKMKNRLLKSITGFTETQVGVPGVPFSINSQPMHAKIAERMLQMQPGTHFGIRVATTRGNCERVSNTVKMIAKYVGLRDVIYLTLSKEVGGEERIIYVYKILAAPADGTVDFISAENV